MKHKHTRRGFTQIKCGAFTLIELLVVVLIIGILAAVAVPQYQKAVEKSRYATYKNHVNLIHDAVQRYYLENGVWTANFNQLDVSFPGNNAWNNHLFFSGNLADYTQGACTIWYNENGKNGYVSCGNYFLSYRRSLQSTPERRLCQVNTSSAKAAIYQKVCEAETSLTEPSSTSSSNTVLYYNY